MTEITMSTKKSAAEQAEALFDTTAPKEARPAVKAASGYLELLAQQAALEEQIALAREAEVGAVLEQIRQLVADYGLENEVTFTHARGQKRAAAPAKYRDPQSGKTWSGRGKAPLWLKGKDKEQFLIA
jgi:DNA-binding protein H-NS